MVKAITTGVFQVPELGQSNAVNDIINIVLKNPSSKKLTVNFIIEYSPNTTYGTQTPEFTNPSTGFYSVTIDPKSTFIIGVLTTTVSINILWRFSFWGDIDRNEKKNKLSIEVISGAQDDATSKLGSADATVFFRHENFVDANINVKGPAVGLPPSAIITI